MILLISISSLTSDAACFEQVRALRWPDRITCPHCDSLDTIRRGKDDRHPERQRYQCKGCQKRFDDLTDTVFEGHHQPLKVWVLCLNLSNQQIARELRLNKDDALAMAEQLRQSVEKKTPVNLSGHVEFDEVYVKAVHKGNPGAVANAGREGRRRAKPLKHILSLKDYERFYNHCVPQKALRYKTPIQALKEWQKKKVYDLSELDSYAECGTLNDRDVNAARNIARPGIAVSQEESPSFREVRMSIY